MQSKLKTSRPHGSQSRKTLQTTNHSNPPVIQHPHSKADKKSSILFELRAHQQTKKKIPKIINQLQKNIKQLKKCYVNSDSNVPYVHKRKNSLHRMRSQTKIRSSQNCTSTTQQIDDVRKSYTSIYGKSTSNLVQLYNFYRKEIEKSTGALGSITLSNKAQSLSMTNNHADFQQTLSKSKSKNILIQNQQQHNELSHQKGKQQMSSNKNTDFRYQRKSIGLINPFLQKIGVNLTLGQQFNSQKETKTQKELVNVKILLAEDSNRPSMDKHSITNLSVDKQKRAYHKRQPNPPNQQVTAEEASKQNRLPNNFIEQKGHAIPRFNSKQENLNVKSKDYLKVYNQHRQDCSNLISFGKLHSGQKSKEETKRQHFIQKNENKNDTSSSKKSLGKKSSHKKTAQKKSSSKKSPNQLNEAVFFQNQSAQAKNATQICKGFQGSKYYVKPVPFRRKLQDSLDGLEITLKENSKCLDLEFIPLDI